MTTQWPTILPTTSTSLGNICEDHSNPKKIKKEDKFAKAQKACQKGFRCLTSLVFHCSWSGLFLGQKNLNNIMTYCVILYNMIIEDERDFNLKFFYDNIDSRVKPQRRSHSSIS
jgi:hypothetical protein